MRREFPAKVKLAIYNRCLIRGRAHCEKCDLPILGVPEFDHIRPDGLGGEPTLANGWALCGKCHRIKTHGHDRPIMQKADNQKKAAAGIKRKGRKLQSRNTFKACVSNTKRIEEGY